MRAIRCKPLNIAALLAALPAVKLPGPELYVPARDGRITLPSGKRPHVYRSGRYLAVWVNNRTQFIHRLVAELILGVTLSPRLHIHHVNGNTRDNRPENLLPMDGGKHSHMERTGRPLLGLCDECGELYVLTRAKEKGTRAEFCGTACRLRYFARVLGPAARRVARSHERGHSRAESARARRDPSLRWRGWL